MDLDPDLLLSDFLEESELLLASMAVSRERLRAAPSDRAAVNGLSRDAHTLRGLLRLMVDLRALDDLARRLEEAINALRREPSQGPGQTLALAQEVSLALEQFREKASRKSLEKRGRAAEEERPAPVAAALTILLVDDSRTVRHFVKRALDDAGYHAITAGTTAAMLEVLAKERPALILLDLSIAEQDHQALLRKLSQIDASRRPPIVLFSNQPETMLRAIAARLGAAGYLRKTNDPREIVAAVVKALPTLPTPPARPFGGA